MIDFTTDKVGWSVDETGMKLTIWTPQAKEIAESFEKGKFHNVKITMPKEKRGLSANSMYWSYLTKLAYVLKTSNNALHNQMLRRYGQLERYGEQLVYVVLPDSEDAEKQTEESETYHLKPTSQVKEGKDGRMYRTYMLLRGSSTYDTVEFSRLLDGLLGECRECGINVISEKDRSLMEE